MTWKPAFREISIRGFNPGTSRIKKIERKEILRYKLKVEFGKDLPKIKIRCENRPLLIDVTFYLYYSDELGRTKKDLDNLMKILLDVLSIKMNNGQDPIPGLAIVNDDSDIRQIKCKKHIVNSTKLDGIDLHIFTGN